MKKPTLKNVKSLIKEYEEKELGKVTAEIETKDGVFTLEVKRGLSVGERAAFIQRVVAGCFDAYEEYRPEMLDAMIKITALQMCTNLPVIAEKNTPETNGEGYVDIDAMARLYDAITDYESPEIRNEAERELSHICMEMWDDCKAAVKWKKKRMLARGTDALAELCESLRGLVTTLGEKADEVDPASLAEYAGKLSSASEGLNGDNIIKFLADRGGETDNG